MHDEHRQVDCEAVVAELYTFLDGELTEANRVRITRHLSDCSDCHEVVDFYAEFKMTISAKCREQVPDHLRDRIMNALGLGPAGPGAAMGIPRF